ncbi:MAG: ISNCY family transposase, partial [Acidobacteria bacterium]|nr:ISNCY family transposase [Acidobacteriota bacterium]
MGDRIEMSGKERERLVELERVRRGEGSLMGVARRLGVSYRQAKRWWRRYVEGGARGLVHRGRGRPSNRRKPESLRGPCVEQYRERLEGFGPTLASEKLGEWGWEVDHETLRRWLVEAGLWQARPRRQRHRRWRPRKEHFGEMVQLDGSFHDWFERKEEQHECLLSMIDDATGKRMSWMEQEETTADAMRLLGRWIQRYGIPCSLYVDRKTVYITDRQPTIEEELSGEPPLTAFGRACRKLGIEIIAASSPQAKGRIERSHGVYQDRLVKEIRLRGLRHRDEVNALLAEFDAGLNRRFAVPALSSQDFHRPPPKGLDLAQVFVWEEIRTVQNDWTVRFENRWLQILGPKRRLPPVKGKVVVQRRLD